MSEKFNYNPADDEEIFAGEILPELLVASDGTKGPMLILNGDRNLNPKDFEKNCRALENLLSMGHSIKSLVANRIVLEQSFVSLLQEYESQRRPDPNNYKDKLKKYFKELNK